jgi:hypothetical protein
VTCDQVGTRSGAQMYALGAVMLHEMTHWQYVIRPHVRIDIEDHAYAPEPCQKLAVNALEAVKGSDENYAPMNNADSYVW